MFHIKCNEKCFANKKCGWCDALDEKVLDENGKCKFYKKEHTDCADYIPVKLPNGRYYFRKVVEANE